MSRRNPQPYLEAKVTLRGGDCQYADYWPGRTPGEIAKELGVTLREVELISAEKGKGWVRIYPRAKKNPSQTWKVSASLFPRKVSKGRKKPRTSLRQVDLQVSATNLPEAVKKAETAITKKLGASDISLLLAEELPDKSAMFELCGTTLRGKSIEGAALIDPIPVITAKARKNAYRHSDLQHVHDYDFPVGRKNRQKSARKNWRFGDEEKHPGYLPPSPQEKAGTGHWGVIERAERRRLLAGLVRFIKSPNTAQAVRAKLQHVPLAELREMNPDDALSLLDRPSARKNARGAIPAIGRGERHGYAPEGSLRRKERSIDEISEIVDTMKASPGALRPFEQRKKARKKGQTRIVRPKGNPIEYLTASEYIKGLDAGLFKVDDPRIKVLSEKKPRHATPKEAFADGFSAARSAWHSGQHDFSDIGYWILKNAKDGSLFEERSTFGDEYRRGAKEYWLARKDAESRRTGWESSDWLERGLNNPLPGLGRWRKRPKGYRSTGWEMRKFGDGKPESRGLHAGESMWFKGDYVIELDVSPGQRKAGTHPRSSTYTLRKINVHGRHLGRFSTLADAKWAGDRGVKDPRFEATVSAKKNPSVKVGDKIRTSRGEEGEVTEIRDTWGYVAGALEGWFPLSSLSQMRVLNNPDWRALGEKTKRGAQKGWKATKHAGKVAAWQAEGAVLKTELADLRRCAKNLGYDDYKSGPAYQAAQERVSAWKEKRPVKQNPVWVSPEGTAGYLSGESHTRYKKKHPQRGLVPKFMERQVRLETPRQDPPPGYRILDVGVIERGRPVTHFRVYRVEGGLLTDIQLRDTGKYARDWNKAVQIAHKLAKKGREALKAAANPPASLVSSSAVYVEDIKCYEQGKPLTQKTMATILGLSPSTLRKRLEERRGHISGGTYGPQGLVDQYPETRKNPRGRRDMTMLIGEDGAEWAKWSQNREGIIHRNPWLDTQAQDAYHKQMWREQKAKRLKIQERIDEIDRMIDGATRYGPGAEFGGAGHGPAAAQIRAWVEERDDLVEALRKLASNGRKWGETTIPPLRNPQVLYFPGKGAGGSGPRGGYSPAERAELPRGAFLKPGTRSWPVSDKEHAKIALQYMTRGFGNRSEYPLLLQRLASFWPVDQNPDIWAKYREYKRDIEEKCRCLLPTVEELRDVSPSSRDWPPARKNSTKRRRRRLTHWY